MATAQPPSSTHHSLAFRVMRLCRPSLQAEDAVLRLDPLDLVAPEDLLDDPSVPSSLLALGNLTPAADFSYRHRFQLRSPLDAMALPGLLMLPQSFGAIYLGEKFCSYISINNSSSSEARDVVIKAEIQTERQRLLLLDTSKSPVESIRSGGRYDFIVEHDVKELGPHTLVCSALYNDGDSERKYLPQFFKFQVANPLSVRTKVRAVKDKTYLEACIENHTKSNLYMDQVDFEPAPHWNSIALGVDDHPSETKSITREIFKMPGLIRAGGGIRNYLYQLNPTSHEAGPLKVEGSNVLGKLQITWRSNLGEPGRLQTQNILGSPITKKEVEVQVLEVPSAIIMEKPFLMQLKLKNHIDRKMGPFEIYVAQDDASEEKAIMINGLQKLVTPHLEAFGSAELQLNIIATRPGIQKITGITVSHVREGRVYDTLPDVEIFVDTD